jgi:hypothetical protein
MLANLEWQIMPYGPTILMERQDLLFEWIYLIIVSDIT